LKQSSGGGDDADGGNRKGNWDCDGKEGSLEHTSVKILLDWWMAEGNYSKYCGKNNQGVKKVQFCNTLAEIMSKETSSTRTAKNVQNKIQHIEKTFKEAHNFANSETGAGLREQDEGTFEEAVKRYCPYYYDLLPIMQDRASSKPKATSYDSSEESDEAEGTSGFGGSDDGNKKDGDLSELSDNELIDTNEEEDGKSLSTKRTNVTSVTGGSSMKKSRGRKKKQSPLMDDEAIEALSKASKTSEAKMKELVRHHKFLEGLEEKKLAIEEARENREVKRSQIDDLEYKMKLVEKYKELKSTYSWNDDQIVTFFPEMKQVVDAQKNSLSNS
jgi:hypothetical protein